MSWEKFDKNFILFWRKRLRYLKIGLVYDDLYNAENPIVIEAINRLPKEVLEARDKRLILATELSLHKTILHKEEWTPIEIDVPYLRPYIDWVTSEMEELDSEYMSRYDIPIPPFPKYNLEEYHAGYGPIFDKRAIE